MKGAIAIILVLSASALLNAAETESESETKTAAEIAAETETQTSGHVSYDLNAYKKKIFENMDKLITFTTSRSDVYMKSIPNFTALDEQNAVGKLALAAELISAVGSDRQLAMKEAAEVLKGQDFESEMRSYIVRQFKADSSIQGKLESLIKLADGIGSDTVYTDVKKVVVAIRNHRQFLINLRKEGPQ